LIQEIRHLRPADELASEALTAWRKHAQLADNYDWDGDYDLAVHHRNIAAICKDDAEHYAELGTALVALF
jgi:hypothetical protein